MTKHTLTSHGNTPLNDQEQTLFNISERVLHYAKKAQCSATDLSLNSVTGGEVCVRHGQTETVERNQDKGLTVHVFMGHQTGSASTTDFSDQALKATVDAAASIAKVTEGDPCLQLADAALYPQSFPDLQLNHPNPHSAEAWVQFGLEQALECEQAALDTDPRISNSEGASCSAHAGVSLMRNTNGFCGFSRGTQYGLSCSVIAGEQNLMQRDYWYDNKRKLASLEPAQVIGKRAAQRAISRLGAQKISTRRAPVLFDATIAPSLLGHFISAINGNTIYKKASFLADKLGETLFPEHISIFQSPHTPAAMGSAVFDADGVATQAQHYVEQGRLSRYVLSQYSACKLKMKTTGNAGGVRNLGISHDDIDQTALLKKMGTGLLVTELMGFGVTIVTGDYSRGAAGFWVENGEIQYPVHEITLSGQLANMFTGISAIANDTNTRGNIQSGSLLIDEMTIGGS